MLAVNEIGLIAAATDGPLVIILVIVLILIPIARASLIEPVDNPVTGLTSFCKVLIGLPTIKNCVRLLIKLNAIVVAVVSSGITVVPLELA